MSPLILLGRLQGSLGRQRNIVVMLTAMLLLGMGGNSGAIPHDVRNVEPGHHEGRCRFEAIVSKYRLEDPAILLLSKIVPMWLKSSTAGPEAGGSRPSPRVSGISASRMTTRC